MYTCVCMCMICMCMCVHVKFLACAAFARRLGLSNGHQDTIHPVFISICFYHHQPKISSTPDQPRKKHQSKTYLPVYLSIHTHTNTPIHQYDTLFPAIFLCSRKHQPNLPICPNFPTNLPPTNLLLLSSKCFRAS